jgi:hypothetical protein
MSPRADLSSLPPRARHFWTDPPTRAAVIEAASLLDTRAVARVDDAVVAVLDALEVPRGPVQSVEFRDDSVTWAGRKDPDCTIYLSVRAMRAYLTVGLPDAVVCTWMHESFHARLPFVVGSAAEYREHSGYEEGLVEGLARSLLRDQLGISEIGGTFEYYVIAYQALALVLGLDLDRLRRRLWQVSPGAVRVAFPGAVTEVYRELRGTVLLPRQMETLRGIADTVFQSKYSASSPDTLELQRLWEIVFR